MSPATNPSPAWSPRMPFTDAGRRLLAVLVLGCSALSPVLAQQSREELARDLPSSTLTGADVAATSAALSPAPGFANARIAENPAAAGATAVGERTCIACHQLESEHFTHT